LQLKAVPFSPRLAYAVAIVRLFSLTHDTGCHLAAAIRGSPRKGVLAS
jgi:hypothetical protein